MQILAFCTTIFLGKPFSLFSLNGVNSGKFSLAETFHYHTVLQNSPFKWMFTNTCNVAIDKAEQKAQILLVQAECRISFDCDDFLSAASFALLPLAQ